LNRSSSNSNVSAALAVVGQGYNDTIGNGGSASVRKGSDTAPARPTPLKTPAGPSAAAKASPAAQLARAAAAPSPSALATPSAAPAAQGTSGSRKILTQVEALPIARQLSVQPPEVDLDDAEAEEFSRQSSTQRMESKTLSNSNADRSKEFYNTMHHIQDITREFSYAKLTWDTSVQRVLLLKKHRDKAVTDVFKNMCIWLCETYPDTQYFVEPAILSDTAINNDDAFKPTLHLLSTWDESLDATFVTPILGFDLVVCLGGDGTLMYAASLFPRTCPPVMSFGMGTLGFLTPFDFSDYQRRLTSVLKDENMVTLRMRLQCKVINSSGSSLIKRKSSTYQVLNELVVDRGPSPFITNLELYVNGDFCTSVQGDGLIIATPTGSTAYSVAAGGSMVHPSVPCILITPICAHSISFRPVVVPANVELELRVSASSRNAAWISMDGRNRQKIDKTDSIHVTASIWPVPTINESGQMKDWFNSLSSCLHWNERMRQKPLDI
jgi:NAD+ kinase